MSDSSDFFESDLDSEVELSSISDSETLADELDVLSTNNARISHHADIQKSLNAIVQRACDVTGLSPGKALLLLHVYKWNIDEMASAFIDNRQLVANKLKLQNSTDFDLLDLTKFCGSGADQGKDSNQKNARWTRGTNPKCPVCLNTAEQPIALGCKHFVCSECFYDHIRVNIVEARRLFTAKCPGSHDCPLLVTKDVVSAISQNGMTEQFNNLVVQYYIESQPTKFKYCPHPNCECIAERSNSGSAVAKQQSSVSVSWPVTCKCQNTFCFNCSLPNDHYAVPCSVANRWLALVDHEHRSTLWISQNTKQCPQCQTKIQRSEGCNHMSCSNCNFQFCWVCSQSWAEHSGKSYYNCVKYMPSSSTNGGFTATASKKQKDKLNFYMLRYDNHAGLSDLVDDPITKTAHNLLAWSYVLLCCTVHNNHKVILEELISDLGRDVEDASPRLRQRTEALTEFIIGTPWAMDTNMRLDIF